MYVFAENLTQRVLRLQVDCVSIFCKFFTSDDSYTKIHKAPASMLDLPKNKEVDKWQLI